jgi:hypothetical protein
MSSLEQIILHYVNYQEKRLVSQNLTSMSRSDTELFLKISQFKKDNIKEGNNFFLKNN